MENSHISKTIMDACYKNPYVSYKEAERMWNLCEEYARILYNVPFSELQVIRVVEFHKAMERMNKIRKDRYSYDCFLSQSEDTNESISDNEQVKEK